MIKCDYCDMTFDSKKVKANHIRWQHKKISFSEKGRDNIRQSVIGRNSSRFGAWVSEEIPCSICGEIKVYEYRDGKRKEKYFCSRSCANKRIHTTETKDKISKSTRLTILKLWENDEYVKKQVGRNKFFNSVGEKEIRDYFMKNFPNDGWTFGAGIKYNDVTIARDLYSNKLKVCFEYDGIWHFKDIHGQLENKQLKDKYLESWCKENDYRLIRVSEDVYKKDKEKTLIEIERAIYHSTDSIIKFY